MASPPALTLNYTLRVTLSLKDLTGVWRKPTKHLRRTKQRRRERESKEDAEVKRKKQTTQSFLWRSGG